MWTTSSSVAAAPQDRLSEDRDAIGHAATEPVPVASRQRHSLVEAQQVRVDALLHEDRDVVDQPAQLLGDVVERFGDQRLESLPGHVDHHFTVAGLG